MSSSRKGRPTSTLPTATPNRRGRHEAAGKQRPVPGRPPARVFPLGAVFERDGPEDQRSQQHEHRQIKPGEGDVHRLRRPGSKDRPAPEDEPDLVTLPGRPDRIDGHTRRSESVLATKGRSPATPKSNPSVAAKPISRTPRRAPPEDTQNFIGNRDFHCLCPSYSAGTGLVEPCHRGPLFRRLAPGQLRIGALLDDLQHQHDHDHGQHAVEQG